ncbi:hypothetical protein CTheo_7462 [Ceratobasidium theobromae]|uniref:Uncharacterized protein n=1 Tax=Ceratobasidium theobromae TaxID=1582974 RepID=A0A5N5QBE4_9AGAM|nr:hypothetical protein CTheo_7462 [Ceratobasidium theobromae]
MSSRIHKTIKNIYEPHPIKPETIFLETEDGSKIKPGMMRVRALDGFVFVKSGEFVYPTCDKTAAWWEGVEAYGLEEILWLDSAGGFSYALLEPEAQYDRGHWNDVIKSWATLSNGPNRSNPGFTPIEPGEKRPDWWVKAGDKAWNHMARAHRAREREAKVSQLVTRPSSEGKKSPTAKPEPPSKRKALSDAREKWKTKLPRRERQSGTPNIPQIPVCSSSPEPAITDNFLSSPLEVAEQSPADRCSHVPDPGNTPIPGSSDDRGLQKRIESDPYDKGPLVPPSAVVSKSMSSSQGSAPVAPGRSNTASPEHLVDASPKEPMQPVPGSSGGQTSSAADEANLTVSHRHSVFAFNNARLFPLDERCSMQRLAP